jgi:bacteriocin-like protein
MTQTSKPRESAKPAKLDPTRRQGIELNEKELDQVSGGACASGKHLDKAEINVR